MNQLNFNNEGNELFYNYLNDNTKKDELKIFIKKHHNKQWSEHIHNILSVKSNCKNDCKYCYMKGLKNRFFKIDIENFDIIIDDKKVKKSWKKSSNKMIMFPSSHDIFPEFIDKYIEVCKNILNAGNSIMIVTKPRLNCIDKLIEQLSNHKDKIIFMLTITSSDQNLLEYYEKNAPTYDERKQCLINLFNNGYYTSISMEPFLNDPFIVINELDQYVTHNIWLGLMSGFKNNKEINVDEKLRLTKLYSKEHISEIINKIKNNNKIMFKTSVMKLFV